VRPWIFWSGACGPSLSDGSATWGLGGQHAPFQSNDHSGTARLLAVTLLRIAHVLLHLADFLFDLTFHLPSRVPGDFARALLDGTLDLFGHSADLILVHIACST